MRYQSNPVEFKELELEEHLDKSKASVFSSRINGFHHREPLHVANVTGEREVAIEAVLEIGVIQITQRPAPTGSAAGVTRGPRLERSEIGNRVFKSPANFAAGPPVTGFGRMTAEDASFLQDILWPSVPTKRPP